jgi:hypothetical protein
VKHYTKHSLSEIKGPVTVVSSAKQRLTFIDTPCDVPAMMDAAKGATSCRTYFAHLTACFQGVFTCFLP